MNWFKKKLLSMLSSKEETEIEMAASLEEEQYYDKNIETKVAYKYPKGNFRFPLIPDEDISRKHEKMTAEKPISPKMNIEQIANNKRKKIVKEEGKKSFTPTKVPSPIYGFKNRNESIVHKEKENEIIEFELPDNTKLFHIEDDKFPHTELDLKFDVENSTDDSKMILEELFNKDTLEETTNEIREERVEELTGEISEEIIDEISDEQEILPDKDEIQQISNEKIDEQKENKPSEIQRQEKEQTKEKRHLVPYNVMMLKKDKHHQALKKDEKVRKEGSYHYPSEALLLDPPSDYNEDKQWIEQQRKLLDETFENFNVRASVVNVTQGPAVTRFEVHPEPGVKVNKITNLTDDIKLSLAAKDIRIEAPIPGKNTIGIEVPNRHSKPVMLKEIIRSSVFQSNPSPLTVALGLDIAGKPVVTDLKKMPHGLIAGATGSGKSVCINAMLVSLLYKASPHEVKLMLIDPKVVELAPYNHIPHLVCPVITDVKAATAALKWAVEEMERRYESFAAAGVRDITRFNELAARDGNLSVQLPYLVIVIDELADLMMVAPSDVEEAICRIAQKARACGIHLIIATQRPSVDVITGLIKANIPTRIAFSVSSQVDSRTIIDMSGAERLLGKGDMLFLENGSSKPFRVQGNFVSDDEIDQVVTHVKSEMKPTYLFEQQDLMKKSSVNLEEDKLFYDACEFVIQQGTASTSSLQRHFRIGYNRAARLIDMMEEQGMISQARGSKPRDVLMTEEEFISSQDFNL